MAEKSTTKPKSEDVKGKVILQFGAANNFNTWRLHQIDRCSIDFGFQANILKNNVIYVPPAVVAADYTPAIIEGEPAITATALATLRLEAEKQRNKEVHQLKLSMPKFFATLWESMSIESKEEVTQHAHFLQADLLHDPNILWTIIRETHLTRIHGIGLGPLEIVQMKNKFGQLRQKPGTSIGEFKKEFDLQYEALLGADVLATEQPELAMLFLSKLDPHRYATMLAQLTNDATLGRAFPQTLHTAWSVASGWKTASVKTAGGSDMQSVFVLADEVNVGRASFKSAGRYQPNAQKPQPPARNPLPVVQKSLSLPTVETRTCRGCLAKGHIYRDCPDNPKRDSKVMIAQGEHNTMDDDIYDASAYMVNDCCDPVSSSIFFTATEVLLDNQAGRSIFKNKELLSNVGAVTPFYIGGIDGGSRGLCVQEDGEFKDLGRVGLATRAAANILSKTRLIDAGNIVSYDADADVYRLRGAQLSYTFSRKINSNGSRSSHYACDMALPSENHALVATIAENMRQYTKREVGQASHARELMARLGHASSQATIDMLDAGLTHCAVTKQDVRNADAIFGSSIAALKGKTHKLTSIPASAVIAPRVTQVQQILAVDIFFIKTLPFLLGQLIPLGLAQCIPLKNRSALHVANAIRSFVNTAKSRDFDCVQLRTDGEGALGAMRDELSGLGIVLDTSGPGQHVPVIERKIQLVKERVRAHVNNLPYVMTRLLLTMCVLFCVSRINMQPSRMSTSRMSPIEQFTGMKIDAARDLRVQFGDYVQATVRDTDNSMRSRTLGCIAMLPMGNLTGSVKMWCLATSHTVIKDQFKIVPMSDLIIKHINTLAAAEGYTRETDLDFCPPVAADDDPDLQLAAPLPDMMAIDGRLGLVHLADNNASTPDEGVNNYGAATAADIHEPSSDIAGTGLTHGHEIIPDTSPIDIDSDPVTDMMPPLLQSESLQKTYPPAQRRGGGVDSLQNLLSHNEPTIILHTAADAVLSKIANQDVDNLGGYSAFTISVRAALRDRREEATPVIMAELKQMLDKHVWHGVHTSSLTPLQRSAIIRSSMFLKDKYLASGAFERFKARLVAGGNQQDKGLYYDLSSPTVATSSVLTIAAIAAAEGRKVIAIDIGGAFLNADMSPTGIDVHMRLDRVMSSMLIQLDPSYEKFRDVNDTVVVRLDKALYGCVEASLLWYKDLKSKLIADGFIENPYDRCVFNKTGSSGKQISIALHVDDLMVTSECQADLDNFGLYLKSVYPETRTNSGEKLDYVGMSFDFTIAGQVCITMPKCVDDILSGCGVETTKVTPASSVLFDVRDAPKASDADAKWFHTHVAKILYLAKRVRPECLTAVAFLSTRVAAPDIDDLAKLRRLLGYIRLTSTRGIVLRVGPTMVIKAYIDAAYGVHQDSGKSHTGCTVVLGEAGPTFSKSAKQKIVTKSSTEAELVGLSDTASQAIHLRNLIIAQGYDVGPAVIYQDNLSCMALIKRGGPGSERSRHIHIRQFWLSEKVTEGEVELQHLGTEDMFANILTKPVQGAQFDRERLGLTNWKV